MTLALTAFDVSVLALQERLASPDLEPVESIVARACSICGVSLPALMQGSRVASVSQCRMMICYYLRTARGMSFRAIAREVGMSDTTSAMAAVNNFPNRFGEDPQLRARYEMLAHRPLGSLLPTTNSHVTTELENVNRNH